MDRSDELRPPRSPSGCLRRSFYFHRTAALQDVSAGNVFQGGIIARGTPDELKGKAPGAAKNGGAADMTLEEAFIAYIEEVQRKGGHA